MPSWHWPTVGLLGDQCLVMSPFVDLRAIAREVSGLMWDGTCRLDAESPPHYTLVHAMLWPAAQ